ncbi:MAG: prolipoprotein diacylglyceryl transferase [Gammaproteobacteria bacterium]|nr:prolipoprotein diacylglyceryl transferase [Gammaproteobacteria bacterium]
MLTYPDINPVAVDFGFFKIYWYGISYVAGIVVAWWLLHGRCKTLRPDWTREQVADLIFYGTLGILIGGRLGSVLFYNFSYYLHNPLEIIMVNKGGMSFHGGLAGFCIALWLFGRKQGKGFFTVADFVTPVGPVGLLFGRLANFINGELWGRPTDVPWGMVFPHVDDLPRHPSQLYEAVLEGIVMFLVLWWFSRKPQPAMAASGLFLAMYGLFRGLIEFFRQPDKQLGFLAGDWLTMGMLLSLPMIVLGLILLWLAYQKNSEKQKV